ncbi:unnamed protein product [Plasmodium vivax]|uniref:(malaria parasite P. vivax) hypothetical protein n=1 Tax=Plasmodium vivax TaxID=5855 RepID=A0A8S4H4E4_PLAVI|nr:unnamed protein product [Plasmodium vivax]
MVLSEVLKELESSDFSFRGELYSEKFNASLYNLENLRSHIGNCSSLDRLQLGSGVKNICARVLKYLETIYAVTYNPDDPYDVCLLLNYWVYSKLFYILQNKDEKYVRQAYGELQPIWNDFVDDKIKKPENQKCRPIHELVLYDDWRERKKLYEYYVDYSSISKTLIGYNQRCKKIYKYVESKKPLYKHFEGRCPSDDTKICPDFYKRCEQYDPDKVLSHLSCHNEIIKERKAAASRVQIGSGLPNGETESRGTSDSMVSDGDPNSNGNPHNVRMYGNVLLGVVATSMTSGALYRFTPLGGIIRNGLGWNTNNMININGGDIRLYDYASDSFNPYPGEEHYIGYHPA